MIFRRWWSCSGWACTCSAIATLLYSNQISNTLTTSLLPFCHCLHNGKTIMPPSSVVKLMTLDCYHPLELLLAKKWWIWRRKKICRVAILSIRIKRLLSLEWLFDSLPWQPCQSWVQIPPTDIENLFWMKQLFCYFYTHTHMYTQKSDPTSQANSKIPTI